MPTPREILLDLFEVAVRAAQPRHMLLPYLPPPPEGRLIVIGAGKAAASMASFVEEHYLPLDTAGSTAKMGRQPLARLQGLVIVPYGYRLNTRFIEVAEAGHPVPDDAGVNATSKVVSLLSGAAENDLVLCLISGGASALLCAPAPGVSLAEKQELTSLLLRSGAPITSINTVRKALSLVKGGRLARVNPSARLITLILSDVVGDDPSVIGSGPTAAELEPGDAEAVLKAHAIELPPRLRDALRRNAVVSSLPTSHASARQELHVVGSGRLSLLAAQTCAQVHGLGAHILSDRVEGESREAAKVLGAIAHNVAAHNEPFRAPCVLLSGGETTVTVRGAGRGGSNLELALALSLHTASHPRIWAIACDTDGSDGGTSSAGALIGPGTIERAQKLGLNPVEYLRNNDAFSFFAALGDLVTPGPTFTNVNDFRAVLIE